MIPLDHGPPLTLDARAAKDRQREIAEPRRGHGAWWALLLAAILIAAVGLLILLR